MSNHGTLLHCDEAIRFIDQIEDPVTKNLVNMAFVHFVKAVHMGNDGSPICDIDMHFVVKTLKDVLSEHDVLSQTLDGEKVGAWFGEAEG